MRSAPVRYRGVARRAVLGLPPTFRSYFKNVGDKPCHIVEFIKSSSLAICSGGDFAKMAHASKVASRRGGIAAHFPSGRRVAGGRYRPQAL